MRAHSEDVPGLPLGLAKSLQLGMLCCPKITNSDDVGRQAIERKHAVQIVISVIQLVNVASFDRH